MKKLFSKYLAILLLFALSPCACQKAPDVGPEPEPGEGVWTKVHYRATVSGSAGTKATLDAIDRHYLFERDDLMYVVDKASGGDKLYGYLYLISGADATEAVFEGDLMYFVETPSGSGKYEPERPANDLAVSATLVSQTQRDAGVYTTVTNNEGKITGPNFVGDLCAPTFKEAVQKYSTFTADATFGDPSFHLVQGTAFLIFSLAFEDSVTGELSLSVTNNSGADNLFSHSFTPNPSSHDAHFVAAFQGGTITLSNAKMTITGEGGFNKERALASTSLQENRYYNVTKTFLNLDYFTIQAREAPTTSISFPTKYQDAAYGLQYSRDGSAWTAVPSTSIDLAAGESIMLRGKGSKYQNADGSGVSLFTSSAPCYIYGDIMSLFCTVDGEVYTKKTAFGGSNSNALDGTFRGMTNLDIHPARPLLLSATTLSNNCYQRMFYGCTGLTRAPEFNNEEGAFAANIPQSACKEMFYGCTALLAAPELPANGTIAEQGYCGMFNGCTSMATPPARLAVNPTTGTKHFMQMFSGCSALLFAPELPATSVKTSGCQEMFKGCTSLMEAPELFATTVASNAYTSMFENCSALVTGPSSLSATVMNSKCYQAMFKNCVLLEAAPRIDAGTLAQDCFREMFFECHALRTAQDAFAFTGDIPQTACYRMFYNCLALNGAPEMLSVTGSIGISGCEEMYSGCVEMRTAPSRLNAVTLGDKGYRRMFYGCVRLTNESPAIAATSVGGYGCQEMFRGCTRLQNPPATMNAMTLGTGAYSQMFYGCRGLTSAPTLPATSLAASVYYQMFYGCSTLVSAPALPATNITNSAYYQMFYGCSALTSAPTLSATTLADSAYYQMFYGCSALASAPALPAMSVPTSAYQGMFYNCTSLVTPPSLPATTLATKAYQQMFFGCTKLESIPTFPAEVNWTGSERVCYQMFQNCSSLTELTQPLFGSTLTLSKGCFEDMFAHCTSLATVPAGLLPATTLAVDCYRGMFQDTALTSAPNLLAPTIVTTCYRFMFNKCKKLTMIRCHGTNPNTTDLENWLKEASSSGTLYIKSGITWPTNSDSGVKNGWTTVAE